MKTSLLILFLLLNITSLVAQDKITTKNNKVLEVEIIEVTNKYVKYRLPQPSTNIDSKISLQQVLKIEYKNGNIDSFEHTNPRIIRPWGFSFGYLINFESQGATVSYNYFILPSLELGLDLGTLANSFFNYTAAITGKYHFRKPESTSPISMFAGLSIISISNSFNQKIALQVPTGIYYLNQGGFKYAISLVPITDFKNIETYLEVRVGYNFKKK